MASEGMMFFSYNAQSRSHARRAASRHATGRIPIARYNDGGLSGSGRRIARCGMGAGSVLKTSGYKTYFTGKWDLGEPTMRL